MSQSLFDAAVPSMLRTLTNLNHILELGQAHAEQNKIDPAALLGARLFPDMFAFTRQVQIVSDNAKGCIGRLAAVELPKFEDTESSFAELRARLDKTAAFIKGISAAQFAGADARAVELKFPSITLRFANGWDYLLDYALPNTAFHFVTAYNLLRHNGVKVGKGDYIGQVSRG